MSGRNMSMVIMHKNYSEDNQNLLIGIFNKSE